MMTTKKVGKFERAGVRAGKEYPTCAKDCGVNKCLAVHLTHAKCEDYYKN